MICKLCHQDRTLLKRSHIIPGFLYKPLYNEYHKIYVVECQDLSRHKLISSGYYEKDILCKDCDNKVIGALETYASRVLKSDSFDERLGIKREKHATKDGIQVLHIEGIDYVKFKLFLLSMLWRASISRHEYFDGISLGEHEEIIRTAILTNDPMDEESYQVCITACNTDVPLTRELILNPKQTKGIEPMISFYITGAFYLFSIAKSPQLNLFRQGHLKSSNEIEIPFFDLNATKRLIKSTWNIDFK